MGDHENKFTGTNEGHLIQARDIDWVYIERGYAGPIELGDIRFKPDLPRTLDLGDPGCVGRESELARLVEVLGRGKSVVLRGPDGIGKTTLLRHAAHHDKLTISDIDVVVWTSPGLPDADQILKAVLDQVATYPGERPPVPGPVLRRAMTGLRALVIVEDPRCTAAELAEVRGAMRRSVFVVTTDRGDLKADKEILLAGLSAEESRLVLESEFDDELPAVTRERVEKLCEGYGHHPGKVVQLGRYLSVARTQRELEPELDSDEAQLIVPRLVEWLDEPTRAAVLALAALDNAEWGWPLLAAVADITTQSTAKSLQKSGLAVGKERYRLAAGVVEHVPTDVVAVTERITDWAWEIVATEEIAAEIGVIEQALERTLRDHPETALALAFVAATKLAATRHWDAWGRVLPLGLKAAIAADSRPGRHYFRYSLAARKNADGRRQEAAELVGALMSDRLDTADDSTAERVRRLADQVGYRGTMPAEQAAGLIGLLRQAVLKLPDPVQQFVISHPQAVPASVLGLVSLLVAGLFTASAHQPDTTVVADPNHPIVTATTTPGSSSTTGIPGAPTTSEASTAGSTGTNGGTPIGNPSTGGGDPGQTTGNGGSGGTPSPPPTTLSWGFVRDDMQDDNGQPRQLDAKGAAANWSWGIWNMQSPPAGHPTASHVATGWDRITMPHAGTPGGTVMVTAFDVNPTGVFCQPSSWGQNGVDEIIDVRCFTKAGAPANVKVFVFFAAGSGTNPIAGSGTRSYVVDDRPTANVFGPDWQHGRNAGNVTRTGTGRYTAELAGAATGVVELTAIGADPKHCSVLGRNGDAVDIACFGQQGGAVDTAFAASVANNQNFLDDKRKPVGDYVVSADPSLRWASDGQPTRVSTGQYHVHFGNGYLPSAAHVTAEGDGRYCMLTNLNDYSYKDNTLVYVACYTTGGTLADTDFDLLYTSTRSY
ncbi:MAG TPA: hypothetical protein VL652_46285 [Kutzneria sp.]|nr:hypothetical protein [Kutzneria sp.]